MTERVLAFMLLLLFFAMDFMIRKDSTAKKISATKDDNKSTFLIGLSFFAIIILSVVLTIFQLGTFHNPVIARTGLGIMIAGFIIRIHSMRTLSNYYTRTLVTVSK